MTQTAARTADALRRDANLRNGICTICEKAAANSRRGMCRKCYRSFLVTYREMQAALDAKVAAR